MRAEICRAKRVAVPRPLRQHVAAGHDELAEPHAVRAAVDGHGDGRGGRHRGQGARVRVGAARRPGHVRARPGHQAGGRRPGGHAHDRGRGHGAARLDIRLQAETVQRHAGPATGPVGGHGAGRLGADRRRRRRHVLRAARRRQQQQLHDAAVRVR